MHVPFAGMEKYSKVCVCVCVCVCTWYAVILFPQECTDVMHTKDVRGNAQEKRTCIAKVFLLYAQ